MTSTRTAWRPTARVLITLLAALSIVLAQMVAFGVQPASAGGDPDWSNQPTGSSANQASNWVNWAGDNGETWVCTKLQDNGSDLSSEDSNYVLDLAPPAGSIWRLAIVKQATPNYLFWNPTVGDTLDTGGAFSHVILCSLVPDLPDPSVNVSFTKIWEGDNSGNAVAAIRLSDGDAVIATIGQGQTEDLTDYQGETLTVTEILTAPLPEGCEYTPSLDSTYTVPTADTEDVNDTITATNTVTCEQDPEPPFVLIQVDKVFSDNVSPEPDFRVELTTTELCWPSHDRLMDGISPTEVALEPCLTFEESTAGTRQSGLPIPLGESGQYTVDELTSAAGYTAAASTIGDFSITDPANDDRCEAVSWDSELVRIGIGDSVDTMISVLRPEADFLCTHTVVNNPPPPPVVQSGSASVTVVKAYEGLDEFIEDGQITITDSPQFEVGLRLGATPVGTAQTVAAGVAANFSPLSANTTYTVDVSEVEDLVTLSYDVVDEDGNEGTCSWDGVTYAPETATVTATSAGGSVTITATNSYTCVFGVVEEAPEPAIDLVKTAVDGVDVDEDGNLIVVFEPGDTEKTVTYRFVVTNTGDEALVAGTFTDDKIGGLTDEFVAAVVAEYGNAILPVGGSVTFTADHVVTVADFDDAGLLTNVAIVTAEGVESGEGVSADDDETVNVIEVLDETTEVDDPAEEEEVEVIAFTGSDSGLLLTLGLLLSMMGLGALMLGRRRAQVETS